MEIYFLSIFICFFSGICKQLKDNKIWFLIVIAFLCIFLCFGYMCGSDWRNYEEMYENIDIYSLFSTCSVEPGYYVYMLPFKLLNISFWNFFIFTKIIVFYIIFSSIIKFTEEYIYLVFMFFVTWYGFYLFIDNPMRNLIAIAICMLAIKPLIERKCWKYFLIILIAISFHISAIIMIPVYFYFTKKISSKVYIIVFILVYILFASSDLFWGLISKLFGWIPYIHLKIESYTLGEHFQYAQGRFFSLGTIVHVLFFILIMYYRKKIEILKNGVLMFNAAILYLLFYRVAVTVEIFGRILFYFCIFYTIIITYLITIFEFKSRTIYIFYLLFLSIISTTKIFADFRYIPYTNYITYFIKGEYPSYEERSEYNYINSPYAEKE